MALLERKDVRTEDTWDLSTLYSSDQKFDEDLKVLEKETQEITSFSGRLNDAAQIRAYLDAETELGRRISNIYTYAMLRNSEDTADNTAQVLMGKAQNAYVMVVSATAFAQPEMLALPEEELHRIADSKELEPYRFLMEQIIEQKPHTLSREEEKLLAGFAEVMEAPKTIADSLMDADLVFTPAKDSKGKEHAVTNSNFVLLQQSGDRTLRENVFHNFYAGYKGHINTFAAAYSGIVKSSTRMAAARHYASSRAMAMDEEHVPESVYDSLVQTVREYLPQMYRYVALRKKLLGVEELHYYDVYVPLTSKIKASWTYEQAQQMVLNALAPLGKAYTDQVENAFRSRWIDVYPNKGKRGGAYSSGTYDSNPFIMSNFTGDYESVSTIAHEMGHSMHTFLANHHQPPQYAEYTLFVAEVASTVNENLLVEYLLSRAENQQEKLFLLNQYLEGFKGTLFRQTMFAEFERDAHRMAEAGEALTPQALSDLYGKLVQDYFGPDLVMDDEVRYEWARIPHFYRPFYVYKYATSYSASVAISEAILQKGDAAVKPYLNFLSMGGSAYPIDELKSAGVDLTTPAPIAGALDKFGHILDEVEKLVE